MKLMHSLLLCTALGYSCSSLASQNLTDDRNPNLFVVLGCKAKQTLSNTLNNLFYPQHNANLHAIEIIQRPLSQPTEPVWSQQIQQDLWQHLNADPVAIEQKPLNSTKKSIQDEWIEVDLMGL